MADRLLRRGGGVEAHDEVVAGVVLGLVLRRGLGEQERAPVRQAADHAAGGEDLLAGCARDSARGVSGLRVGFLGEGFVWGGSV